MSLLGVNPNANDDYKNDIKPDGSVPAFTDSFSSISWAPTLPQVFAATAWNGELRVFEVTSSGYGNAIVQKMSFSFQQPALKCAWNDQSTQIYVGLMDGCIKVFDIGSGQAADVGRHSAAISSLHFVPGMNTVVSSGYESNVQFWQLGNPNPVMTFNAENKIYTSDFQFPMLVAGTANEKIMIVDINNASSRTLVDSNDLGKFSQIQSIAINQKCTMFGVASFDGRANLSSLIKNVNGMFAPVLYSLFRNQ
jgi:mRNA export factor